MSYRDRIYREYATTFKDSDLVFDEAAARRWGKPFRHYLRGWLPENKAAAIVDVACGNGMLLYLLKSLGYTQIAGVDISVEQTTLAKQVTPNVSHGDALAYLQQHPCAFDAIFAMDVIEHFDKDEVLTFLDRAVAALRPGGRLILQTPNAESPMFNNVRYGDFTHEGGFTPDSLARLMRLSGLERPEARETGPVIRGPASLARTLIWRGIRGGLRLWQLAENGNPGSGVLTRVFVISALKP
jgi:SAM-dependent methyltransferase